MVLARLLLGQAVTGLVPQQARGTTFCFSGLLSAHARPGRIQLSSSAGSADNLLVSSVMIILDLLESVRAGSMMDGADPGPVDYANMSPTPRVAETGRFVTLQTLVSTWPLAPTPQK